MGLIPFVELPKSTHIVNICLHNVVIRIFVPILMSNTDFVAKAYNINFTKDFIFFSINFIIVNIYLTIIIFIKSR